MPPRNAKLSTFERLCAEKGVRLTGKRRLIGEVLAAAEDHPDIEELHRRASQRDSQLSLATVYRTVRLFEEGGLLARHDFGDGRARYELEPRDHHDHLIDMTTGAIVEFESEEIERLQVEVARRMGYRLVGHRLELYGVPLKSGDSGRGGDGSST